MPPDVILEPGQTAVGIVSEGLEHRATWTGWGWELRATQNLVVRPVERYAVDVGADRPPDSKEG